MDGIAVPLADWHASSKTQLNAHGASFSPSDISVWRQRRPKARPELELQSGEAGSASTRRILFDRATRQTYRIGQVEAWLLEQFDGSQTVERIYRRMQEKYRNGCPTEAQLIDIVVRFDKQRLLFSMQSFDESCTSRESKRKPSGFAKFASSITVWRFPGLNLDPWLAWAAARLDVLFSRRAVEVWLGVFACALVAIALNWTTLLAEGVSWELVTRPQSLASLFSVFLVTRALHELGHALVCRRFGIRCPDIGLLMIVGTPCVYCDVSESWKLPQRWKRAAIAAAGMYVELMIAALATLVWTVTVPGTAHTLALHTMLVCSVATILVNANPLLRFDGYHILADWLDEANLRQRSDLIASRMLDGWILGRDVVPVAGASEIKVLGFAAYSWMCWAYRLVLAASIAGLLVGIYSSWQLAWVGRILGGVVLFSMCAVPVGQSGWRLTRQAKSWRGRSRLVGMGILGVLVFVYLPIPQRYVASGWAEPKVSWGVYAPDDAILQSCEVADGQLVRTGTPLFSMQSFELEFRARLAMSEEKKAGIRLVHLRHEQNQFQEDVDLEAAQTHLENARERHRQALDCLANLKLKAPNDGRFSAAAAGDLESSSQLRAGPQGTWCAGQYRGRLVDKGTLLGTVHSSTLIAVIPLDPDQQAEVTTGTEARLHFPGWGKNSVVMGNVSRVVSLQDVDSPWQRSTETSDKRTNSGNLSRQYAALIPLESLHGPGPPPATQIHTVFVGSPKSMLQLARAWLSANLSLLAD